MVEDEIKLILEEEVQSHSLLSQFNPKDTNQNSRQDKKNS